MMKKINGKAILIIVWLLVVGLLVYSRFFNLGWGFPYAMHPDERNMVSAIEQLSCQLPKIAVNIPQDLSRQWVPITNWVIISDFNLLKCFNPHFFAYGQFPLYLGYVITYFLKFFDGDMGFPISFQEAAISLRIISAMASIINVFVLLKIVELFYRSKLKSFSYTLRFIFSALIFTLSPQAIQFAHFGTTESLLMLFYSLIVYLSMRLLERQTTTYRVICLALVSGLAVATKVSSAIFLIVPVTVLISKIKDLSAGRQGQRSNLSSWLKVISSTLGFALCTLFFTLVFSPHNLLNFKDFIGSMNYESDVALGKALVFYTRQFFNTAPIWFQLTKIFPYVLGWPVFILGSLGLLGGLGWKDKKINLLRFAILVYFIPSSFLYAKWTRFISPVFPLMLVLAILFLLRIKIKAMAIIIVIFAIIPGIAYLSVYQNSDIRFQASEWIYKNIPENSYVLSETANVVDIPMEVPITKTKIVDQIKILNYKVISFNFYSLDENPEMLLFPELRNHLQQADYIFVPSRRLFANHYCEENYKFQMTNNNLLTNNRCQMLKQKYPILNQYYTDLFNGKLGFKKVAEFESFPKICWPFSNKCLVFADELSEETWTVFDHPVVRIYKKI